ncbi:hypothetical protein NL676_002291 [Syzygium grande]|nr:hypothetical protein NL676_002291 [Syzygium grande]
MWSARGLWSAGVRAQVATVEKVSTEGAQSVESPVVIVTRASRGIGKAMALSLGKAGCKEGTESQKKLLDWWNFLPSTLQPVTLQDRSSR